MSGFKAKWKVFWRIVRECFLRSLTPWLMYFVASIVMLTVYSREMSLGAQMAWAVICAVVAIAYNGLLMWVCGGTHYEMLVSGNMKRRSAMQMGSELNITSYKYQKEYRPWKGFVIGAFASLFVIVGGIVFGCNQDFIGKGEETSTALAVVTIIFDLFAGWALIPFQVANIAGIYVNYFIACALAILPVGVSGGLYIAGAYGRRNKTLRAQEIAARAAEEERNKPKKINYGGLPGTKPKKRK